MTINSLFNNFIAVFFAGISIKLMDDYLDQNLDELIGKQTLAIKLRRATIPYALLSFSLSVILNIQWAISLFWGSYIIGMGNDLSNSLPSGLKAYQESIILFSIGCFLLPIYELISSILIIFNLQLIDDLIDAKKDEQIFHRNFTHILGERQAILLILIILVLNLYLHFEKTILVFLTTPLVIFLLEDEGGEEGGD
ncbi:MULTISPECIES: hypothetical protein [unclassified Candidatus Frackibacter]|uniref:hypothetical protein n=1 Tax=unclassified Candidatus Frackibacter TaxID=2648818 RepID=UPI000885999F|nr:MULTISPECIES: hypothetical protein [unclassified Candidatus Frackibacter]SDC26734.1 hypothetical protein SAMN04515661_10542 [Candidatus Frackibacter sp. WG11]SEM53756.1 hypothetical protein SAMN04488698_10643 [Candidatus Frackibacter sp. WG12]SFL54732.1 hypothetical protein SAMN04488699_10552 [Candidatus Frackibacter sp. WG13]